MKKKKLTEIGLPETVKLCVRPNRSSYNEVIGFKCRELRRKGHMFNSWFYSGSVFITKCQTDEESIKIHYLNQLPRLFPDFKFTFEEDKQG